MRACLPFLIAAATLGTSAGAAEAAWRIREAGGPARIVHAGLPTATASDEAESAGACADETTGCGPKLGYADVALEGSGEAAEDNAPRLAYTFPADGDEPSRVQAAIWATPASLPDAHGRPEPDLVQLVSAVRSEIPAEQRLAGLVTITNAPSAPLPLPHPAPAPAPAPAPKPTPGPICLLKLICL
ncbi:MAG TPA: hypothetical protein VH331_06175 [Allosphingosinicella sp.]|jgi:hypothetical protein|nr:hypothetical protein [Allosphingosinicella sp.]